MDNNIIQFVINIFTLLFSLIGFVINVVFSRDRSDKIFRFIEVIEKNIIEKLNKPFNNIIEHFDGEMNRIFNVTIRELSNLLRNNNIGNGITNINDFEINKIVFDSSELYRNIQKPLLTIKKLNSIILGIKIFRWTFCILLAIILILILIYFINSTLIPSYIGKYLLVITILIFIFYMVYINRTNDHLDKVMKDYGI